MGQLARGPHLPDVTELTIHDAALADQTVALAAAGDQSAFARLVATHHAPMARVAYAITGDPDTAADAVQVAWAAAWRGLPRLRDHGTVQSWLVAIAANEARQILRRRKARPVVNISVDIEGVHLSAPDTDPAEHIDSVDLARALRGLGPDDRALLALRFVAGFDSTQIATHLGLSASGVRSRLTRLLERLRKELDHA